MKLTASHVQDEHMVTSSSLTSSKADVAAVEVDALVQVQLLLDFALTAEVLVADVPQRMVAENEKTDWNVAAAAVGRVHHY